MILEYIQTHWLAVTLAGVGAFILLLVMVRQGAQIRKFTEEVRVELKKASWPWDPKETGVKKYKELIDSTMMVLIAMMLLGGYIAFWDFLMVNIVSSLLK